MVALTGAADQIDLPYFNGVKMFFDAVIPKDGVAGFKIELMTLDDGYNAGKAATNARRLLDEGIDALFGFAGSASCDASYALAKPAGVPFFAPFAASDSLYDAVNNYAFLVRPAKADEACKIVWCCVTVNQNRIAVFAEDDAMAEAHVAAIIKANVALKQTALVATAFSLVNSDKIDAAVASLLKANQQSIILVSLFKFAIALIRKARKPGYGGQFLTFLVVGFGPFFFCIR